MCFETVSQVAFSVLTAPFPQPETSNAQAANKHTNISRITPNLYGGRT